MNIGSFGKPSLVKKLQPCSTAYWLVSDMMMVDVCHKVIRGDSIGGKWASYVSKLGATSLESNPRLRGLLLVSSQLQTIFLVEKEGPDAEAQRQTRDLT